MGQYRGWGFQRLWVRRLFVWRLLVWRLFVWRLWRLFVWRMGSSSSTGEPIISKQLGGNAVLLTATGKLRGSRARALGDQLDALADGGVARVVLDLTALTSLDSLAAFAIERALERGLRVHLVVRPSFQLDQFFAARSLGRRGLRAHHTLEDALARVRQISDSTVFA